MTGGLGGPARSPQPFTCRRPNFCSDAGIQSAGVCVAARIADSAVSSAFPNASTAARVLASLRHHALFTMNTASTLMVLTLPNQPLLSATG
jgi:hypothetical protein